MRGKDKVILSLFSRYVFLALIAVFAFDFIYTIFRPLTIFPVYYLLRIFFNASLNHNIIFIGIPIEIIDACIAGSAYFLLLFLNLSIPKIKFSKRVKLILFSFLVLLLINIFRIFLLSLLAASGSSLFDIAHKFFWYSLSIIFVVGIWFFEVKLFKIKQIPVYSDLQPLYKMSSLRK
ncbi:pacearchaeosortase [Candidatus Pacearchaeota archaeon]|nr:pacearchaeosortase [Candidatus Pacearchaeota archaeon]